MGTIQPKSKEAIHDKTWNDAYSNKARFFGRAAKWRPRSSDRYRRVQVKKETNGFVIVQWFHTFL
jgi:hypothetical protein